MQLQIAMNTFYDLMMQRQHCLRNAHDRITLLEQYVDRRISCQTLSHIFSYHYQ